MCYDSKTFLDLSPLPSPIFVNLPNSYRLKVTHVGSVNIHPEITLKNVLLVPSFTLKLISVHKLCKQLTCLLIFSLTGYFLQVPSMKRPLEFGEARSGLYLLESLFQPSKKFFTNNIVSLSSQKKASCFSICSFVSIPVKNSSDVRLWHLKLGHMPFPAMKNICSS